MKREEGVMGKLILLERTREEAAREALAGANEEEDRARTAEREAEERRRRAVEAIETVRRDPLRAEPAQILLFRSRAERKLERIATAVELRVAELKNQRMSVEQARARVQARWEASRKRRERLEEKRDAARAEARKRREDAVEREQDDRPVRPEDEG